MKSPPPSSQSKDSPPQYEQLHDVLSQLEQDIKRQNSLLFVLLKGMVYGFGTVIGATILIAVATAFITSTFGSIENTPFIGSYLNQNIEIDTALTPEH